MLKCISGPFWFEWWYPAGLWPLPACTDVVFVLPSLGLDANQQEVLDSAVSSKVAAAKKDDWSSRWCDIGANTYKFVPCTTSKCTCCHYDNKGCR